MLWLFPSWNQQYPGQSRCRSRRWPSTTSTQQQEEGSPTAYPHDDAFRLTPLLDGGTVLVPTGGNALQAVPQNTDNALLVVVPSFVRPGERIIVVEEENPKKDNSKNNDADRRILSVTIPQNSGPGHVLLVQSASHNDNNHCEENSSTSIIILSGEDIAPRDLLLQSNSSSSNI